MSKHEPREAVSVPTNSGPSIANDETRDQMDATPLVAPGTDLDREGEAISWHGLIRNDTQHCIVTEDQLSCRVMDNCPGPGWYWEVFRGGKIVARGLAE